MRNRWYYFLSPQFTLRATRDGELAITLRLAGWLELTHAEYLRERRELKIAQANLSK